ncbi:MAG: phosphocholine cytidylyltransferase family protein [Oceanospirillaceae bacterium]|nr:phosphocholine cytidylyltransferase family protein [Oceanospirillaceae bacterium]
MTGVVLAAGKGSRLGTYTTALPKSLLPLNDEGLSLLDFNLCLLSKFDLEKIIIVTGFQSEKIEAAASGYDKIEIVYNPFWDSCNVLGSLYMALDKINDDFLFLHADTLMEEKAWELLINQESGDMILPYDAKACGEEEMKVLITEGKVTSISKLFDPSLADGEFVGIAKFKVSTLPYFKSKAERFFKDRKMHEYMEAVIQSSIDDNVFDIRPLDISEYRFVEVDFVEDYLRAKQLFG